MNLFTNLRAGRRQTVVVYGTSLTHIAAWPEAMKGYFDRHFPGRVTFINSAMSGQHSRWGLANLQERVLAKKPDLVLIEFSANDAALKHRISQQESLANLVSMIGALRAQNPAVDIVLQTMSPSWDSPDAPAGKKPSSDRPEMEAYYELYRTVAREQGLRLIDHYPKWIELQQRDEPRFRKWIPDGSHPIPEASLAITWPAIEAVLEQGRRL